MRRLPAILLLLLSLPVFGKEEPESLADMIERAKQSVVAISQGGRDGGDGGLGTGVIISEDGLVATNFHVIGEGRPLTVEFGDGNPIEVEAIHAWDRKQDVAILKLKSTGLKALPLGDPATLRDGEQMVAIGNPQGLRQSVVEGALSARREIPEFPGTQMLQMAMAIMPGNSGGPLLDARGRVQGLVTLRSTQTENVGYAVPVDAVKKLLAKPNTVPMARWETIGALDPKQWKSLEGRWTQRAGHVRGEGRGKGFGGRTLCLWQPEPPAPPYEVAVKVRLGDETGAAGLVFCADGGDCHYGFYPSDGRIRLSRFEGPDVEEWRVLEEQTSPLYKSGDWNSLKVRVEESGFKCFLNGAVIFESADTKLTGGRVGLCKFRQTQPEFQAFRLASEINESASETERERLIRQAKELDKQASDLRRKAAQKHLEGVARELEAELSKPEEKTDLIHASLLVSKLDNPDLEIAPYLTMLERMGAELTKSLDGQTLTDMQRLEKLNTFFFKDNAFHGSEYDLNHRSNSYLNEVLDDREGMPLTLSILYMELGEKIGLNLHGVNRPEVFALRFTPRDDNAGARLLDVFAGAETLDDPDAEDLEPATKREIIARMLRNLTGAAKESGPPQNALPYLNLLLAISPDEAAARLDRAILNFTERNLDEAKVDVAWLLEEKPDGIDLSRIGELMQAIDNQKSLQR